MKTIQNLTILLAATFLFYACQSTPVDQEIQHVSTPGLEAQGPNFSQDHLGNLVLSWTEILEHDSLPSFRYARYQPESNTFSPAITVPATRGTSTAPESVGKVAFKEDGTVIVLFNKPFQNPKSRFASAIYYTLSTDDGAHWSKPEFIHSDTSETYGRSFFNMIRLQDGEVGAIWLDGRFGEQEKGSALFFSRTDTGKGFGQNHCLDRNTCECCRTEMLMDEKGAIHIAYRGIQLPSGSLGKQVRDMVYRTSNDNGETFSNAIPLAQDNWEIEGCPHTGPSLATTPAGVHAIWFTGGGIPGLYYNSMKPDQQTFGVKKEMSLQGRHPQMTALADNRLGIVWDELASHTDEHSPAHQHGQAMAEPASDKSQIKFTLMKEGQVDKQFMISNPAHGAHHPVLAAVNSGILVAWVNQAGTTSSIDYVLLKNL